ncbi:MAG: BC1881 family protein [Acidobacterium ailaaui]|nr:BC1881 family protein [Pseudacidobacterium ailaaui]
MAQTRGENKSSGNVTVKITADVDEAVAGLKRLQRVARETVKEFRELESVANEWREVESLTIRGRVDLSGVPTKELIDELVRRDGVELINVGNDDEYDVRHRSTPSGAYYRVHGDGPANVIVVASERE